ncbi:MAG: hypothetical protein HPY50_16580 [Firmicutes bacterium]|nr:hypothetical protein [Bacillota bacterium]
MKKAVIAVVLSVLVVTGASCGGMNENPGETQHGTNTAPPTVQPGGAESGLDSKPADKDRIELEGTIGKDLQVHMSIRIKDGQVDGSYYYDRYQESIPLKGSIDANRMVTIKEYEPGGAVNGTFYGWYAPGVRLAGDWTNEKTKAGYPFKLRVLNRTDKNAVWSGEWYRLNSGRFDSGSLVVFNEDSGGFEFRLEAFSGANNGSIDGKAEIAGNRARFRDAETGASMSLVLDKGLITVEADEKINQYHAGAGVAFDGEYKKGERQPDTVLSLGMVETGEQEAEFKRLVGEDVDLFIDTAQRMVDEEDLDGYGARVKSYWVRGVGLSNQSIIMLLPGTRFCAAVIDPENDRVKVYTNADYIDKVPRTIEKWRENFKEYRVEFIRRL